MHRVQSTPTTSPQDELEDAATVEDPSDVAAASPRGAAAAGHPLNVLFEAFVTAMSRDGDRPRPWNGVDANGPDAADE